MLLALCVQSLVACVDNHAVSPADATPDLFPQNMDCSLEARCDCGLDGGAVPHCTCHADWNPCCPYAYSAMQVLACQNGAERCAIFSDGCIPADWHYVWPEAGLNSYLDGFGLEASASDAGPRDAADDAQGF